ncbi:ABC transporter B family member 1-like [Hibiscus syriacus]|uniref:ABC transporter B family member 1-like n=1 Tax=Hibiscus syriacus TaxID=106335 RepID=A0A6A3C621_HIBSY|nr:arginine/serine-rich coiled-coil protein 2-like [Hibiscus syriacus]KAE8724184.1 ABC transporter B family member 1-like [Hibiscus syriacus]
MDPNLKTSPPDSSDAKAAFRKPSNDTSSRQYRRRTPVSGLSSAEGSSPQRDRSVSPMLYRDDLEKSADTRPGRDGRELDRDSTRNQYSRNGDSYRYSDRPSSRSSHCYPRHDDYVRHDKRGDEDSKYDRFSSRADRESRISGHSDHPRHVSDRSRSKDYSQNADKYTRDRYDGAGHRSKGKEKESPFLECTKYKDKDSSFDRVGFVRKHGNFISEEIDRDRRCERGGRDEKVDYHRSSRDKKGNYTSFEESRGHRNDSSSGRERDTDKRHPKEGYRSGLEDLDGLKPFKKERMNYDEGEVNVVKKDRFGRVGKEQFEDKSIFDSKNQEPLAKRSKFFSLGKGSDYDKDEGLSLEQTEETVERVTIGPVHSSVVDTTNDVNAAKFTAMKAAELVNRKLIGAGQSNMTTEQKKKLLWGGKKSSPAEESGHRWDTALFGDRERQEKFNKLMGVKGDVKVDHKADNQDAEKQHELQLDLEKQYTAGLRRRDGRTVGLGL